MKKISGSTAILLVFALIFSPLVTSAQAALLDPGQVRQAAKDAGLDSLKTVPVPVPDLSAYLNPGEEAKMAAIAFSATKATLALTAKGSRIVVIAACA